MEQKIEGTVDNFLDSMASELYLGSIWFGLEDYLSGGCAWSRIFDSSLISSRS